MSQITLYLDDETAARMKDAAEAEGLSQSKWVVRLIQQKTASTWPKSIARAVGAWNDFLDPEVLRVSASKFDVPRESL